MQSVFQDEADGLSLPGVAPLAASCMREAAGVTAFERALSDARVGIAPCGLSPQETAFLVALGRYFDTLANVGLVELGTAAALLADKADCVFPHSLQVLMAASPPLSWIQRQFFSACQAIELTVEPAHGVEGVGRAPEGVRVRFAFPSGRMAEPGMVGDIALAQAGAGDVVVVCKDPLDLHGRLESRLASAGVRACVQASKPFSQTDFGRAFLALFKCLHSDPWDATALSDVLVSPFSGLSHADAFAFDAAVRADRVAAREDVLAELRASSELFSQLEEVARDPEADVLIGAFEQVAQAAVHRSAAWRAEQFAAMGALREAASIARRIDGGIELCVSVLERSMLSVSTRVGAEGSQVLFTTQSRAACLGRNCCATLIVADVTSEDYPVADKDDAASTLLAKLALDPQEGALSRARREFCSLLQLPTESIHLVRPLGNANAEATYPSAVLEEFIDAYRPDSAATEDIDNAYRLPADLQEGLAERGEELLFANERAVAPDAAQSVVAEIPQPHLDDRGPAFEHESARCPSPSQVEVYLECPYQWFATRRLRVDELDEGFGPLERGTFAHAVLEAFYRAFQDLGYSKVNGENLGEAKALMRHVLEELRVAQFSEEPRSGRLVPATELEKREADALCEQLVAYLDFEARFLPTFHPAYFEYQIEAEEAIEYAGYPLVGKVDRIDVDDCGHAVIVDYKGSVNAEHEISGKTAAHAGKVQTRMYARAVERALGLNVVGALYVSYGRNPSVAGAYDPRLLEAAHLPGMRHDHCACGLSEQVPDLQSADFTFDSLAFDGMLDATEELVAQAVAAMRAGEVTPCPSYARTCSYCPVLACPKRGA